MQAEEPSPMQSTGVGAPCCVVALLIDGIMRKEDFLDILKLHLKTSARKLPKICNNIKVLEWPSQSPPLKPIKPFTAELTKHVQAMSPTNLRQLHEFCQKKWANIPATFCKKHVEGDLKRLIEVITNYDKIW